MSHKTEDENEDEAIRQPSSPDFSRTLSFGSQPRRAHRIIFLERDKS